MQAKLKLQRIPQLWMEHVLLLLCGYVLVFLLQDEYSVRREVNLIRRSSFAFSRLDGPSDNEAQANIRHDHGSSLMDSLQSEYDSVPTKRGVSQFQIPASCMKDVGVVQSPARNPRKTQTLIIVPYRDRAEQLKLFLPALRRFLHYQPVDYQIIVVEHVGEAKFNKGSLINIGYIEAEYMKVPDSETHYDCVIIHDIDFIPIDGRNSYDCLSTPDVGAWQLTTSVDKYNWSLPDRSSVGGVNMATKWAFLKANGWSNRYFGWGGEDNDFFSRLHVVKNRMRKRCRDFGRYRSLLDGHRRSQGKADNRFPIMRDSNILQQHEGLPTVRYRLLQRTAEKSHAHVSVELWSIEDPDKIIHKNAKRKNLIWPRIGYFLETD